jgi:hypothetical protein
MSADLQGRNLWRIAAESDRLGRPFGLSAEGVASNAPLGASDRRVFGGELLAAPWRLVLEGACVARGANRAEHTSNLSRRVK